jgi:CheY-like chemotaxis protein
MSRAEQLEEPLPESKPLILCVDDEPIPLTLRKCVLERSGFDVIAINSGSAALEIIEREPIDLVLTDMLMPGLSGTDLARAIKQRKPELPIILFSGVNEIPEDAAFADLFLSKVEGPAKMCAKVSELLHHSQQR